MLMSDGSAPAPWDGLLSDEERAIFEAAGWGRPAGFGQRPAVLVIDMNYNFCGDRPEPILKSIQRWRYSCGEVAWTEGIPAIKSVLQLARAKRLPVIYTTSPRRDDGFDLGVWKDKSYRSDDPVDVAGHRGNDIVDEIRPLPGDLFIEKRKPSAFFGTPLVSHLTHLRADSLIIMGTTTSGCVRASAVDAISYDFRVVIPQEAVFDRSTLSHKVSLMDIHMKYADVTTTASVLSYLEGLETGLFDAVFPPYAAAAGVRHS
jgi:nicotinamidase-related amidase